MKRKLTVIISFCSMVFLILDTRTVLYGASEGIILCLKTVIPALFPFIFLSVPLTAALLGSRLPQLFGKLLRMPQGCESLWLVGILGGYPIGAQCIAQAAEKGRISPSDARRMLCFCSNAGPSFIFGIGMGLLGEFRLCLLVWLIQLLSSIAVCILTPGKPDQPQALPSSALPSLSASLRRAITTMAMVCGWVLLFRIVIEVLAKWILWPLPVMPKILCFGMLELANGCHALMELESAALRFILFCTLLSFGGLCVAMQTFAVTANSGVDATWYLPAKMCQAACSFIISSLAAHFLFPGELIVRPSWVFLSIILSLSYGLALRKNGLEIQKKIVYNKCTLHTR